MDSSPPSRFARAVQEAKSRIAEITPEDVRARSASGNDPVVIDVREDAEYEKDHAQGAIHLSKGVLEREIERAVPDPAAPVIVYCGGGSRSALAADALKRMGYSNVSSMRGGMKRWRELGFPVESGPVKTEKKT